MSTFSYKAIAPPGGAGALSGRIEAESEGAARDRLRERGLIALSVRAESPLGAVRAALRARGASLRRADRSWFFLTLHRLLASKAALDGAVEAMHELAPNDRLRDACARVRQSPRAGGAAHEAVGSVAGLAGSDQVALLRVGHASGRLDRAAELIARSVASRERIRRAVGGRLVYPAVLVVFAALALCFLSWFVIPRFAQTLASAGATLPLSTRITLEASRAMAWAAPLLGLTALLAGAVLRRVAPEWRRGAWERWSLRAPVVRTLVWNAQAAAACETVATMVEGGADVLAGLGLAAEAATHGGVRARLEEARSAVRAGSDVAGALHAARALPPEADAIVRVGVRAGDLTGALRRATEQCLETQERITSRLLTLMEPAVILVMAGAVLWIITSLVAGMLSINDLGAM